MDSLRSILVHVDGGTHTAARLEFARALAAWHEARLSALFAVALRFVPLPVGHGALNMPLLEEIDPGTRERVKGCFNRTAATPGWPVQWDEIVDGDPIAGFSRRALHADLLVLGQYDPQDATALDVPRDFVESVLVSSGTPALVVPRSHRGDDVAPGCLLVAWQPTREAACAVKAALPLLQSAREVHLVNWSEDATAQRRCLDDLGDYLRLHGVDNVEPHGGVRPAGTGDALLELACGVGADWLVMGCYGHARARELVLGGASRTVLRDAPLPVFMAH